MSERNGFEHGVPCWVDTWQKDGEAAGAFYSRLFGWEIEGGETGDGRGHWMCNLNGRNAAAIGAPRPDGVGAGAEWGTYIWVDDVDVVTQRALAAGGAALIEPFDSLDGGRMAILADPQGASFGVWQPGEHGGAQIVNEFGAWAMSALSARDPEAAASFYGDLFGWETEAFGPATMFRLPGFVGGEPSQPVARDVVAVMVPTDGPAAWNVDFWIEDVDAAAELTRQLGGDVVIEPYDNPQAGMRQAVLADPAGAGFSVTRVHAVEAGAGR